MAATNALSWSNTKIAKNYKNTNVAITKSKQNETKQGKNLTAAK